MPREMCYRWLVDSPSRVDIDRIYHFIHRLRRLIQSLELCLILPSWGKEKASIRREGQSAEEGFEGVVGVDIRILYTKSGE